MLPPASPPSTAEKTKKTLPVLLEDPVRRRYKAILTVTFIATSGLYIVVDVIFQVTSNIVFLPNSMNLSDPECGHLELPHLSTY